MKAQRYTYYLVADDGAKLDKKRMTEAAAQKANAGMQNKAWSQLGLPHVTKLVKEEEKGIELVDKQSQALSIFGANLRDQSKGAFVVHTTDCKDCDKLRKLREHEQKGVYTSLLEVSADLASDLIREGSSTAVEYMSEIHFAPCVKLPHGKVVDGEIVPDRELKEDKPAAKSARKTRTAKPVAAKVGKDAFGGRLGTRMSKINLEVINAGGKGILVTEIAEKLDEPKGIVGAQLGWLFLHKKGLLTRTAEGDTFRYFSVPKA